MSVDRTHKRTFKVLFVLGGPCGLTCLGACAVTVREKRNYQAISWNVWSFHRERDAIQSDEDENQIVEPLPVEYSTTRSMQPTTTQIKHRCNLMHPETAC